MTTSDPRRPSWLRSLQSFQSGIQQAGPAATAGYTMIGAIGLCGAVGYGADWWLGSTPTGLVSGLLIGVGAGMYLLARGSMASLTPALIMAIGAVVAATIVIAAGSVLGYHGLARPVFGGMIGPVTAVVATWIVAVRTFHGNPAALTSVLVAAFLVKVLFFAVYVVVMIKLAELPARPFGLSFMAFFIGLYAVEAALFARLFSGRAAGSR